jgi:hypothetical protein
MERKELISAASYYINPTRSKLPWIVRGSCNRRRAKYRFRQCFAEAIRASRAINAVVRCGCLRDRRDSRSVKSPNRRFEAMAIFAPGFSPTPGCK